MCRATIRGVSATRPAGRPRIQPRRRQGDSGREQILDAAAQLFTENGFAGTSTRAIALAVGIRQASLYYHFPSKAHILSELLRATVEPSRAAAAALFESGGSAAAQLHALATVDVRLLGESTWNLGALYLLPELRDTRFAEFHTQRQHLRDEYGQLIGHGIASGDFAADDVRVAADLVFALVEAVISLRSQRPGAPAATGLAVTVPDACLRVLALPPQRLPDVRRESADLVAALS